LDEKSSGGYGGKASRVTPQAPGSSLGQSRKRQHHILISNTVISNSSKSGSREAAKLLNKGFVFLYLVSFWTLFNFSPFSHFAKRNSFPFSRERIYHHESCSVEISLLDYKGLGGLISGLGGPFLSEIMKNRQKTTPQSCSDMQTYFHSH
jgi:hypothetical protein